MPSWKDVLVGREEQVGKLYAVNYALKAFGFAEASWDLSKPITDLQETLKLHGPLIVGGAFGKFQYKNDPTSREKIADRTIYGWGAGDRKPIKEGPPYCQSIVIVGAKSGGPRGGYVYYVDPTEGSDPTDPNRQKIYVTTYENLISNIADFKGGGFGKEAVTPPFAYYYPNYGS